MSEPLFHSDPVFSPQGEDTAYALVDERGTLAGWSSGAERMLGYPPDLVKGRPCADLLFARADAGRIVSGWDGEAGDGASGPVRAALRHRDGHRVETVLTARPVEAFATGREWIVQATDVATMRRRDLTEALVRHLLSDAPFLLDIFDTDLRYLAQARSKVREDWYSGREFSGHTISEVAPAGLMNWAAVEDRQRHVLETGEALLHTELHGRLADDAERTQVWSESILPLRSMSGEVIALAHLVSDVTERVHAQDRLALLNDATSRIGSSLDVRRTAQELVDVTARHFADAAYVNLLDSVMSGEDEPASAPPHGLLQLRRMAHSDPGRSPMGVALEEVDAFASDPGSPVARCLRLGKPLIMSGDAIVAELDATDPARAAIFRDKGVTSWMAVPMFARGAPLGTLVLARTLNPDPFEDDDVVLAEEFVSRAAVSIDNACRYSRERATVRGLQRSLLPRRLAPLTAIDAASRYAPASERSGLGGAWFDVIPLSGARVALVVGNVLGQGLHTAVTMGRLRTAARALADLDLAPDEVLNHLDDQVKRLQVEQQSENLPEFSGVSCAYAVYDPISRRCTVARAGHPAPAVLGADGEVRSLDLPGSAALGRGGAPFESSEMELTAGDHLVMYTPGLVSQPDDGEDRAPRQLLEALAHAQVNAGSPSAASDGQAPGQESLDDLCAAVMRRLHPTADPGNRAALLIARVRELPSDSHITWDLAATPEAAGEARAMAGRQLARWGLGAEAFTTELVVSELVTNAIRYGSSPIRLRLIRDRSLICEVSDGSSTSPHVRRALETDEGGRGLFLVAQLARLWGTRYNARGKTIWAETAAA